MTLTIADIERWDAGDVRDVFHAASSRAQAVQDAADGLATLPAFTTWGGEAAEAAREAIGQTRAALDAHGQEALAVANAARSAADEIERIRSVLATLKSDAVALDMEIDAVSGRAVAGPGFGGDPMELLLKQEQLQPRVDRLIAEANLVDMALANAIEMSGGSAATPDMSDANPTAGSDDSKRPFGGPEGNPTDLTDELPSAGEVPWGADSPSSARGAPTTSVQDLLGQPAPAGVPAPLNSRAVNEFKSVAREVMKRDGVLTDQIEQRLTEIVTRAQQPLPDSNAPEPGPVPAPGFGEGFGDRWRSSEQFVKNLIGQGGPGAPGVVESWKSLNDSLTQLLTNPVGAAKDEVEHALNSPSVAYYMGEKAFDMGATAATLPFGGEGAAVRAGLPAELVTEGGAPLAVMRGWDPLGGMHPTEFQNLFGTPDTRLYPDHGGFPPDHIPQPAHLPEGTIIDRFGSEWGQYLSPDGTPFSHRAVPPETAGGTYSRYIVTGEPLPPGWRIVEGPVQPFFGQVPAHDAIQYKILGTDGAEVRVRDLLREGVIEEHGPPLGR